MYSGKKERKKKEHSRNAKCNGKFCGQLNNQVKPPTKSFFWTSYKLTFGIDFLQTCILFLLDVCLKFKSWHKGSQSLFLNVITSYFETEYEEYDKRMWFCGHCTVDAQTV